MTDASISYYTGSDWKPAWPIPDTNEGVKRLACVLGWLCFVASWVASKHPGELSPGLLQGDQELQRLKN